MNVSVDTNILVRAVVLDDPIQSQAALQCLTQAKVIAIALPCLCEFVWVLKRVYGFSSGDVAGAIGALLASANIRVNRPAVDAGLSVLEAGGDFADGVIAFEGRWLGGTTFVSFDREAVAILSAQSIEARVLTTGS